MTRVFRFEPREGKYTTLLTATGLTFGTISALYGLTNNIINQDQYTVLVTVVILSAVVPTMIAQTFFLPTKFKKVSGELAKEPAEEPVSVPAVAAGTVPLKPEHLIETENFSRNGKGQGAAEQVNSAHPGN